MTPGERGWIEYRRDVNLDLLEINIIEGSDDVEFLEKMSTDNRPSRRAAVARNVNTPKKALDRLINDPSVSVRYSLAMDTIHGSILEELSKDDSNDVLTAVASNDNTPDTTLDRITRQNVRNRTRNSIIPNLIDNRRVTSRILLKISLLSEDSEIRNKARRRLHLLGEGNPDQKDYEICQCLLDYLSDYSLDVEDWNRIDSAVDDMMEHNNGRPEIDALCALVMYFGDSGKEKNR